jgi:hypothetical protein
MMWRVVKIAGAIDTIVRLLEAVIRELPNYKFESAAGKELAVRDLAGLARSIQAATSIPQGGTIHESDVASLEKRFAAVEADMKAMLTQFASALGGITAK